MPFLKQNFKLEEPEAFKATRGIEQAKKDDIINKLGSLMPTSRLAFWKSLRVNNKRKDLRERLNMISRHDGEGVANCQKSVKMTI